MEISVIIPVYNKISYLQTLFDQLRKQTFLNFECLLIDDGSTDGSAEACDRFASEDSRVRVYHISNSGVSHARNVGLDHAAGKYITFIDADDEIASNYLENLIYCITTENVDLVISGISKFNDSGELLSVCHSKAAGTYQMEQLLSEFASVQSESGIYGYCVAKLFPAELVRKIRFREELKLAEDFDFYLRLYPLVHSVYLDHQPLYRYRQEAENSTVLVRDDQIDYVAQLRINLRYRDFLVERNVYSGENQQIVEQKINNYLSFSLFYCPMENLKERFCLLRTICEDNHVVPIGTAGLQKLCLTFLRKNQYAGVKAVLGGYRELRNIRNSFRKVFTIK